MVTRPKRRYRHLGADEVAAIRRSEASDAALAEAYDLPLERVRGIRTPLPPRPGRG